MQNESLSSSQVNETLLNAMQMIAQKEASNLEFDVTEKCTIIEKSKDDKDRDCYIVECNGATWQAYNATDIEYQPKDMVFVNVPKNKWTEKKYITGLADIQTNIHYFPDSQFIPIKTITIEDETNIIPIFNQSVFCSIPESKEFLYSNSIYVKCDFKYVGDINQILDYDYGFQIVINYKNTLKTTNTSSKLPYLFSSEYFTGNPNVSYFFTQDILFENIEDVNFSNIDSIDVLFFCSDQNKEEDMKKQIKFKNFEISIGHMLNTNEGLKIITETQDLFYNVPEINEDFKRNLGIIWYNKDEDGNFIGFQTDNNLILNADNNAIDFEASNILTDEYDYFQQKAVFDKMYEFYQSGVCPYDTIGLKFIKDASEAEEKLKTLFSKIILIRNNLNSFINNFSIEFKNIYNYLQPEKYLIFQESNDLSDDKNYSEMILLQQQSQEAFNQFINKIEELQGSIVNIKIDSEKAYYEWQSFISKILFNIRSMQSLSYKTVDNLNEFVFQNLSDYNNIQLPKYTKIKQDSVINFIDIVNYIDNTITVLQSNIENSLPNLILQVTGALYTYYDMCLKNLILKESTLNDDYTEEEASIKSFKDTFSNSYNKLIPDKNNTQKDENIVSIYRIFYEQVLKESFNSLLSFIETEIKNYKTNENQTFSETLFWDTSFFIDIDSLETDNEINENTLYYNEYYIKYKNYINLVHSFLIKDEGIEKEEMISEIQNYKIIDDNKLFNSEFELTKSTENKFAMYWYKRDIHNLEKDLLLNEDCWTLISSNNEKIPKINTSTFPQFQESLLTKNEANKELKQYYFKKCDPLNLNSMISVNLDPTAKTTVFRVVLYYNHICQGDAIITFENMQHSIIGLDNNLIDIEYSKDVYAIPLPKEGQESNALNTLDLSIICYDKEDDRKINTNVVVGKNTIYPRLEIDDLFLNNYVYFAKRSPHTPLPSNGVIFYNLYWSDWGGGTIVIPYGVLRFRYFFEENNFVDNYFPLAWSSHPDVILKGPKILYIKNAEGDYEWDSWTGNNRKIPAEYQLIGNKNITDITYTLKIYDREGYDVILPPEIQEQYLSLKITDSGAYTLQFNSSNIDSFLEKYWLVLDINGKIEIENKLENFKYTQSILILHYNYNYDTDEFNIPENGLSSNIIIDKDKLLFVDSAEKDLYNHLLEEDYYYFVYRLNPTTTNMSQQLYDKTRQALNKILVNDKIKHAFIFYFNYCRDKSTVPDLETWKDINETLSKNNNFTILNQKRSVVLNGESVDDSYIHLLNRLFYDLYNLTETYKSSLKNWQTYVEVSGNQLQEITRVFQEVDWEKILQIYAIEN